MPLSTQQLKDRLQSLISTLKLVDSKMRRMKKKDETNTKVVLINPVLGVLGWPVEEPDLVTSEYQLFADRVDYALLASNAIFMFLEAKGMEEVLGPKEENQLYGYVASKCGEVTIATLSNGITYKVFRWKNNTPVCVLYISDIFLASETELWLLIQLFDASMVQKMAVQPSSKFRFMHELTKEEKREYIALSFSLWPLDIFRGNYPEINRRFLDFGVLSANMRDSYSAGGRFVYEQHDYPKVVESFKNYLPRVKCMLDDLTVGKSEILTPEILKRWWPASITALFNNENMTYWDVYKKMVTPLGLEFGYPLGEFMKNPLCSTLL